MSGDASSERKFNATPYVWTDPASIPPREGLDEDRLFSIDEEIRQLTIRWAGGDRFFDLDYVTRPEDLLWLLAHISEKNWPHQTPTRTVNLIHAVAKLRGWGPYKRVPFENEGPEAKKQLMSAEREKVTPQVRFRVLARDGYRCRCCGISAADAHIHVDHIIPVSKGGKTELSNLQTLCSLCNFGKAAQ